MGILIISHFRKAEDEKNPANQISGTTGLTGAADTILSLENSRHGYATLYVEGRDVDAQEIPLQFNFETSTWSLAGSYETMNPERRDIVEVLRKSGKTMSPKEIADALGKTDGGASVRQLLGKMATDGAIIKSDRGLYAFFDNNPLHG